VQSKLKWKFSNEVWFIITPIGQNQLWLIVNKLVIFQIWKIRYYSIKSVKLLESPKWKRHLCPRNMGWKSLVIEILFHMESKFYFLVFFFFFFFFFFLIFYLCLWFIFFIFWLLSFSLYVSVVYFVSLGITRWISIFKILQCSKLSTTSWDLVDCCTMNKHLVKKWLPMNIEKTKVSNYILFPRPCFLLTRSFCNSCFWKLHGYIKITYNMSKFYYNYLSS